MPALGEASAEVKESAVSLLRSSLFFLHLSGNSPAHPFKIREDACLNRARPLTGQKPFGKVQTVPEGGIHFYVRSLLDSLRGGDAWKMIAIHLLYALLCVNNQSHLQNCSCMYLNVRYLYSKELQGCMSVIVN